MEVNEDVRVRPSTAEESGEVIRNTDSGGQDVRDFFIYLFWTLIRMRDCKTAS